MSLKEKINEDLKTAMKSGDKVRLETVRSIRSLILEFEKSGANREMTEVDELKMLNTAAKKRKDAIEIYEKAGKPEIADKERAELEIIQEYLPKALTEEEITNIAKEVMAEVGASTKQDFGKVMPKVMAQTKGRADGKIVKSLIENFLS